MQVVSIDFQIPRFTVGDFGRVGENQLDLDSTFVVRIAESLRSPI